MKKIKLTCIVDDDPIFVFGIKKMMKSIDFSENYLIYSNGKEALNNLTSIINEGKEVPDVILLDLNMPVMDGWDFLEEFKKVKLPKKIVIYIVTSSIDKADYERVREFNNVSDYVVKPLEFRELEQIKEALLESA
tara:strand:- start:475 stop:879 length:405 start_codon:yes stop_codon:yes gene_type:complete